MGKREYEVLVLILIILISLLLGLDILPSLLGAANYLHFFKPLFWLGVSFYIWGQGRTRFKGKIALYNLMLLWSAICGILYLSALFAGGFIDGIGMSPYHKGFKGIAANVFCFGSVLVLMEYVRNYLINRVRKKYLAFFSVLTVITFTLYRLNLKILSGLDSWPQVVQYLGEYALPEIMGNILLTYLVYIGGASPAIIYIAITSLPLWVIPLLPDLRWITRAFIGTMMPVIFLLVIRHIYREKTKKIKFREVRKNSPVSWIAVSIIAIIIIWFAVGVFPVFPTVILTGSMEPVLYPGDVALINKCETGDIGVGDVIYYWTTERIFIIHRVIEIKENGNYRTKGDSNSAPDAQTVGPEQVKGKMVAVIPKLGILNLLLKAR